VDVLKSKGKNFPSEKNRSDLISRDLTKISLKCISLSKIRRRWRKINYHVADKSLCRSRLQWLLTSGS